MEIDEGNADVPKETPKDPAPEGSKEPEVAQASQASREKGADAKTDEDGSGERTSLFPPNTLPKNLKDFLPVAGIDSELPKFETISKFEQTNIPLASGLVVDFGKDDTEDESQKQQRLNKAVRDMKLRTPLMVLSLAPVRDLGAMVDGEELKESEDDSEIDNPPCAHIAVPVSQIVDLKNIDPRLGSSIIRCNASIPIYRWFQAANLMLHEMGKAGRMIPFPMENTNGDTSYQMLRANPEEFRKYQELLKHCVDQDGVEKGFWVAAKFAYQVLLERGYTKLTHAQVGKHLSDIILMGHSYMRGVLILNARDEDFEEIERYSIYVA